LVEIATVRRDSGNYELGGSIPLAGALLLPLAESMSDIPDSAGALAFIRWAGAGTTDQPLDTDREDDRPEEHSQNGDDNWRIQDSFPLPFGIRAEC
jgi:hypothetical protein